MGNAGDVAIITVHANASTPRPSVEKKNSQACLKVSHNAQVLELLGRLTVVLADYGLAR